MNDSSVTDWTLERHCIDGVCHCDWRLTVQDCVESHALYVVHVINIALSGLVSILAIGILYDRLVLKGHRLFDGNIAKGCLRPKPIDSMMFLLTFFNILRLISSVIIVADIAPGNMIVRSFMFEIPWQFGYGGFSLYLVGIAQTLADSHRAIATGWLPSPRTVDVIGLSFFLAPFILNNICSLVAGSLAKILFAGVRLVGILNRHIAKFQTSGPRFTTVKTGIFKIKSVMSILSICLMLFAIFLLLYGALRNSITVNPVGSVFLAVIWSYLAGISTLSLEISILFNPTINENTDIGLKSSSGGDKSNNLFETQNSGLPSVMHDKSFQGTLSHNAFDDLKQQQLQYQQATQKHAKGVGAANNVNTTILTSRAGIPLEDLSYSDSKDNYKSPHWADPKQDTEACNHIDEALFSSQVDLMDAK
ncbi:hypothetical protein PHYBLDRAFT_180641 [Phycomyces blakesleeanus NRRL 1555(-)]|uniref:Uncharacterized protein n=1 Tax=Phycomyces blakesleeanus (strain ATCC 8743b / DSM 1359 / FGSC 10004 / NBRC 33097 / NRRL 1555) TaxID=763407 RepID=A0A167NNM3_PHYB8|nr:hypothetical protein PHYBLDRAFT_180641 [Phycomyces blakesleeanus NRRL 1555(-)]OAD76358.1 hypothetical protein PHYBLDRAFT_180641 [Phycomyces blakesleeanus NRRL 1555(-)]|eukprot:XP_018294398.1 hypothetical protein PHYBLDRAFT_180641 [Phycomyces blakesleeanus NRRL 1555(-)]